MSRVMRVLAAIQSFFQEKVMTVRRTWLAAAASAGVAMALMLGATNALARDNVTWSVGIGVPGVVLGASNAGSVYYSPPPAYYAPAPVYRAPPPAYYAPPPVVYAPPVIYAPQRPYWGGRHERWEHRHERREHRHDRRDHRRDWR